MCNARLGEPCQYRLCPTASGCLPFVLQRQEGDEEPAVVVIVHVEDLLGWSGKDGAVIPPTPTAPVAVGVRAAAAPTSSTTGGTPSGFGAASGSSATSTALLGSESRDGAIDLLLDRQAWVSRTVELSFPMGSIKGRAIKQELETREGLQASRQLLLYASSEELSDTQSLSRYR